MAGVPIPLTRPELSPLNALRALDQFLATGAPSDREKTAAAMDRLWKFVVEGK